MIYDFEWRVKNLHIPKMGDVKVVCWGRLTHSRDWFLGESLGGIYSLIDLVIVSAFTRSDFWAGILTCNELFLFFFAMQIKQGDSNSPNFELHPEEGGKEQHQPFIQIINSKTDTTIVHPKTQQITTRHTLAEHHPQIQIRLSNLFFNFLGHGGWVGLYQN